MTSAPVVVSYIPEHLDVFYKGHDNALWHRVADNGHFYGEEWLGGVLTGKPTVVSWGPPRLDTFTKGANDALLH